MLLTWVATVLLVLDDNLFNMGQRLRSELAGHCLSSDTVLQQPACVFALASLSGFRLKICSTVTSDQRHKSNNVAGDITFLFL